MVVRPASGIKSAKAIQSADQSAWAQYILASADVGIDPGSLAFSQCVADLHHSVWAVENLYKS